MANVKKSDRVNDTDIKRLNHVGLGLKAIAEQLGCHAATVTLRLKAMGVKPTDTRRSFMEQVWKSLTKKEQHWLSTNLYNAEIDIKKFVTALIKEAYKAASVETPATPVPMPKMKGPADVHPQDAALFHETMAEVEVAEPQAIVVGGNSPIPEPEDTVEAELVEEMPVEDLEEPPARLFSGQ